jgi:hypothetical protein
MSDIVDEKIREYRLLDALYGQVTVLAELQDSILKLRSEGLRQRAASVLERLIAAIVVVCAAAPTLYSLLAETVIGGRWLWIGMVELLLIALVGNLGCQWQKQKAANSRLDALRSAGSDGPLDESESYILTQISFIGTRITVSRAVLAGTDSDAIKDKFNLVVQHFEDELNSWATHVESLHQKNRLTESAYRQMLRWIEQARK